MTTSSGTLRLTGVHHVSAISAHIGRSHDFYTTVLGLRPVIRTVHRTIPPCTTCSSAPAPGARDRT